MGENCGNLYSSNEPLTTEHAIILPGIEVCSYPRYLEKISSVVGLKHIHSIFESNGQLKIYFKEKRYVNEVLASGILLNKDYSQVSSQDFVLMKITLSKVDPAIPDDCIEAVLKTYGHLESPIVHTKVSEKSKFDHIDCGMREVKLKTFGGLRFPKKFNLAYKGNFYEVDAKIIETKTLKRTNNVVKTTKKDKYGKYKSTNILKDDSSLTCESFPEWCKNNPDNCGGSRSQNLIDLLLQVHQSQTCLPKKNYQFFDKENNMAVLFEKKDKLPVIHEQQFVAFSKNCVANSSFHTTAKTNHVLKKKNMKCKPNRTSTRNKQTCDKMHLNLNCENIQSLDSTKKRHVKFKNISGDATPSSVRSQRTKPARTCLNKDVSTKVHNTRGTVKKAFGKRSRIYGKTMSPPIHPTKRVKSQAETSGLGHKGTSSPSPNIRGENKTLSEKSVCDNVSPQSTSLSSKHRSAKEKINSDKSGVCDKNICPSSDSLLNHKTVKRKVSLNKSCTYDNLCSPSNSSLPEHEVVTENTSAKSSVCDNESMPSKVSSKPKQKVGKRRASESDNNGNAICPLSHVSTPKYSANKKIALEKSVVVKTPSSVEADVCNNDASQPSNSSKSRAVKRKSSPGECDPVNGPLLKSNSSRNLASQKRKKLQQKDSDAVLSSKSILSPNNTAAQSVIEDSSLNDSNQNASYIYQPLNQSAIPVSSFSHKPVCGPISNATDTSPSIKSHPTAEIGDDMSNDSSQLEDITDDKKEDFNICDKDADSSNTNICEKELNEKLGTCDLNGETTSLPCSIAPETNVKILSSNNLNTEDSSLLEIPNQVSDCNLEENVSSNVEDSDQNSIDNVIDLSSSKTEKNGDLTTILADEALCINSCEKIKPLQEICIESVHISTSTVESHYNKDTVFSLCNSEEIDTSECQSQNIVPINFSLSRHEINPISHLNADVVLTKTAKDVPFSNYSLEEPTSKADLPKGEKVNKDESSKKCFNDKIKDSSSKLALSANQEKVSLVTMPNLTKNKFNSIKVDSRKCLKSKFRRNITVNPASFLIKNTAKTKPKNNGRCPPSKMVHRHQHKSMLNHQTKRQRGNIQNRHYSFSSTQDKSIYEYEFDSDEDYSDQVSYSKWKNQNCSSKEFKKLDTNFTKRLAQSINTYLQNKKRKNRVSEVMDENSEVGSFNNKIGSISELRKKIKDAISPTSTKFAGINKKFDGNNYAPKNKLQTAGESSMKRKRVNSSENFCSDNDYFEVVHLGDGKHEKLSIIVKKKSKLDVPNKRDGVSVNSDQAPEIISKDSHFDLQSDSHNSKYENRAHQQNIKKCQKRIASSDSSHNSTSVLHSESFNLSSNNISYKAGPKYRIKSNTFTHCKVKSTPETSQGTEFITHEPQGNNLVPGSTISNEENIRKSQQFLLSNSNKSPNGNSSYKIVLQKISDKNSKKSSSQAFSKKINKTKYKLKSNHDLTLKPDQNKVMNKYTNDKNFSTSIVSTGKGNDLRINKQAEFPHIRKENKDVPSIASTVADPVTSAALQKDGNSDEVDFQTCVSGFLQQLASCSHQKEIPRQNNNKNPRNNLHKPQDADICSQTACNKLKNGLCLENNVLEGNQEQNTNATPQTSEITDSFHVEKSHSDLQCSSKDSNVSYRVITGYDSNYGFYRTKDCFILLKKLSFPETFSEELTSGGEEDEQNGPVFVKQEPCDSPTFERVDSIIEDEEPANSRSGSLSVPNYNHDLESSDSVPCQDGVLIETNDNVVITNVISCNEVERENFNDGICKVKDEPNSDEYEKGIASNSSIASSLKQTEVINSDKKLSESVNISDKYVKESAIFQNKKLSNSIPNKSAVEIPAVSLARTGFNCEVSRHSHLKSTISPSVGSSSNKVSFEGDAEVQNNLQNLHCVEFPKGNNKNNNTESNIEITKSSSTFQAPKTLLYNGVSTNSLGKLKKGGAKLTSIDKIAEFCALRKSAIQIPVQQLKISLMKDNDSPSTANKNSSKQKLLSSLPSTSTDANAASCANPNLIAKPSENKQSNPEHLGQKSTIGGYASILPSETGVKKNVNFLTINSSTRTEQNGQTSLPLILNRDDVGKSTFTSCVEEPSISNDARGININPSNPVEVCVDKFAPVQLNQSGCERNNSSGASNRTDTYVVKSVAVNPQYIVNKNTAHPEKIVYPKLYKTYPLSEKKLIAFINCMQYTKNVKHTTMQMLARNKTPGALKDLIIQLYDYFQNCSDNNKKLQISHLIMLLNEK